MHPDRPGRLRSDAAAAAARPLAPHTALICTHMLDAVEDSVASRGGGGEGGGGEGRDGRRSNGGGVEGGGGDGRLRL